MLLFWEGALSSFKPCHAIRRASGMKDRRRVAGRVDDENLTPVYSPFTAGSSPYCQMLSSSP
jgi:hypothetical protein